MTNLKCDVIHCSSNKGNCCCRPEIQVNGKHAQDCCDTCCASFSKIAEGGAATNSVDYCCANCQVPIACTAESCKYNRDGSCEANEVKVSGSNATNEAQTMCATFSCKNCSCKKR